jgi:imidazole glycerol-phosphate synthase subunit HisH
VSTVVLKYNAGNVESVLHALHRIGVTGVLSDDPEIISTADRVIFPGVGEASSAMAYLRGRGLEQVMLRLRQPVLGICLGMQLMCAYSEENDTHGMGIFTPYLKRFTITSLTVPHMGWNQLSAPKGPLFEGVEEGSYVYFAHSYFAPVVHETVAESSHGLSFSAALQKDNFYGVQFHPEKSAVIGEMILRNFLVL